MSIHNSIADDVKVLMLKGEKGEGVTEMKAEMASLESEISVERERINNLAHLTDGSTTGDAELIDIRVGADGVTYPSAGDAVRTQISDLQNDLTYIERTWFAGEIAETGNGFVSTSGVITSNANYKWVKYVPKAGALKIKVDSIYIPASSSSLATFAFFDASDQLIKVVTNSDINPGVGNTFTNVEWNVYDDTAYILITFGNMSGKTIFGTISEYGIYHPTKDRRTFNKFLTSSFSQQYYFHCATSALGDYGSLSFNAKFKTERPVIKYDVYFAGYDEDYTNRVFTIYETNLTRGLDGCNVDITENFQDTSKSIRSKHWTGVVLNLYYAPSSLDSGVGLTLSNAYGIESEWCMINNTPLIIAQYPASSFPTVSLPYHEPYNPMYGGNLCAIGDSLTAVYYKSEAESWVHLIAQWNNMRYTNLGISGNPMAKSDSYTENQCMAERVDDLNSNEYFTHIFVMGGANDYNFSIPIGTNTDSQITTFKGAINHIISTLTAKYPQAKIVFGTTYRRTANYSDKPYADAMLEVCKLHSIPCLNNYEDSGVQFFDANWMNVFGASKALGNNHLNASGDLFVAPRFEHALKYGVC